MQIIRNKDEFSAINLNVPSYAIDKHLFFLKLLFAYIMQWFLVVT